MHGDAFAERESVSLKRLHRLKRERESLQGGGGRDQIITHETIRSIDNPAAMRLERDKR